MWQTAWKSLFRRRDNGQFQRALAAVSENASLIYSDALVGAGGAAFYRVFGFDGVYGTNQPGAFVSFQVVNQPPTLAGLVVKLNLAAPSNRAYKGPWLKPSSRLIPRSGLATFI